MRFWKNARRCSVENSDVLFSEMNGARGSLGVITLNRPTALNALNHHMIQLMHAQLRAWEKKSEIKAVIVRAAEGRAFCAGGDLRLTYKRCLAHDASMTQFFYDEYHLNHCIFHYPKPYIALLDGITFGGGVGISIHGSHRVATERLLFAMPETGIGFFPDVGGTYFLPRLPYHIGFYLGLTGKRIGSDDCVALGITQYKVAHTALPELITALAEQSFGSDAHASVATVIEKFKTHLQPSAIVAEQASIQQSFSLTSMEAIIQSLQASPHAYANEACTLLAQKSPTSLKVTLRAFQLGSRLTFDECMRQEYRLAAHFLLGHDFPEGIRAVIIDKDQAPRWNPTQLSQVSDNEVKIYFSAYDQELL